MTLRAGLLDGRRVAWAGDGDGAIGAELRRLGAWVQSLPAGGPAPDGVEAGAGEAGAGEAGAGEDAAEEWVRERLPVHGLVVSSAGAFGDGGEAGLRGALELTWQATRAVATAALIPDPPGGKLVLVTPAPGAGPLAEALRAALENLARTLSVEWARFSVTTVAVCPGPATSEDELATLIAFLLSPAGRYLSGCRIDLGAVTPASLISAS